MTLCDTCRLPGRCCTGLQILGGQMPAAPTTLEALVDLATVEHLDEAMGNQGLPFMPLWRKPDGTWLYWCPRLTRDGRCGDYENRPHMCRVYGAGTDRLCVEWDGVPPM